MNFPYRSLKSNVTLCSVTLLLLAQFCAIGLTQEKKAQMPLRLRIRDKETGEEVPSFRFRTQPGQSDKNSVYIRNTTKEQMRFKLYVADGRTTDDLSLDGPTHQYKPVETGSWLSLSHTDLSLAPDQSENVELTIQTPTQVAAGDYLAMVFLHPIAKDQIVPQASDTQGVSFGVKIETRTALPVVCRVGSGQSVNLKPLSLQKLYRKGQVFLNYNFQNSGNALTKHSSSWSLSYPDGTPLVSSNKKLLGYSTPGSKFTIQIPTQPNSAAGKSQALPLPRGDYRLKVEVETESVLPGPASTKANFDETIQLP
jgi:hypothetical protein